MLLYLFSIFIKQWKDLKIVEADFANPLVRHFDCDDVNLETCAALLTKNKFRVTIGAQSLHFSKYLNVFNGEMSGDIYVENGKTFLRSHLSRSIQKLDLNLQNAALFHGIQNHLQVTNEHAASGKLK
jgi:hypothetical protein